MEESKPRALTPEEQKFMAFEGLLAWTGAVVTQARRISEARDRMFAEVRRELGLGKERTERWQDEWRARKNAIRLSQLFFQTERHLFCNAAYKLLEYRRWIQRLSLLDEVLFAELDKFARDIDVMRDMNEHAVEYFEGKGLRPHDWVYEGEGVTADASSTVNTKIGGRLDWIELSATAERLLGKIGSMEPFYFTPPRSLGSGTSSPGL